jgi:HTH-type transcriptional regulator/antitoxin HigA
MTASIQRVYEENIVELHPIRTDADYRAALDEIDKLWDSQPGSPEDDRLEILTTLVEVYEAKHYPILPPDPIEALHYYMESRGLTRRELQEYIGSRGRLSEILNRRRMLSIDMIRQLHVKLGISANVLIQPYSIQYPKSKTTPKSKNLPKKKMAV